MIPRLALLGLLSAGLLPAATFRDAFTQTHPLDPHALVRVADTNGSITIKTWDRPEVSIEVEKQASSEDYLKEIEVEIDADPQQLSIRTNFPHHSLWGWLWNGGEGGSVRLVLTVPASVDLNDIRLTNGAISIEGVRGAIDAHTVNGAVRATGLGDEADLSTVNGSIHAEAAAPGPSGHLHLTTVNGSIVVLVGRGANATLSARTVNGGTSCDFPIRLTGETNRRGMHGVIGAGGAAIEASTVNGSVRLQSL